MTDDLVSRAMAAQALGVTGETVIEWQADPDNDFPDPAIPGTIPAWTRHQIDEWAATTGRPPPTWTADPTR